MQIKELLPFQHRDLAAAEILADAEGWKLQFTFLGPDRRWNPTFVRVWPNELPHFRKALQDGLAKYLAIRPIVSQKAEVTDTFGYVTTRVGGFFDGVCIDGYRLCIKDQVTMDALILALDGVAARGDLLVAGLRLVANLAESDDGGIVSPPAKR